MANFKAGVIGCGGRGKRMHADDSVRRRGTRGVRRSI